MQGGWVSIAQFYKFAVLSAQHAGGQDSILEAELAFWCQLAVSHCATGTSPVVTRAVCRNLATPAPEPNLIQGLRPFRIWGAQPATWVGLKRGSPEPDREALERLLQSVPRGKPTTEGDIR